MNGLYVSAEIFANENIKSILIEKPTPNDLIILLVGNVGFQLWVVFQFDALALDLLAPSILIEALSKEDHVG